MMHETLALYNIEIKQNISLVGFLAMHKNRLINVDIFIKSLFISAKHSPAKPLQLKLKIIIIKIII